MATYIVRKYGYFPSLDGQSLQYTYKEVTLDDSVNSGNLLFSMGPSYSSIGGVLPDRSGNQHVIFLGWSTSNTYALSPAAASANVGSSVLTTLGFNNLSQVSPTNLYPVFQYVVDEPPFYDSVESTKNQAKENKLVRTALTKYPEPYLSGLKLNADIEINGLTLNTIDANNVVWVVSDIEGWWTLPENELPDLPRGWGDGSYDAIGRWANRILTLNGSFMPQSPEDAPAARNALIEAISLVKTGGWLIVNEEKYIDPSNLSFPSNPSDGDSYKPTGSSVFWIYNSSTETWIPNAKAAYVRLSGVPQIASVNARGRHDFSIGLKAVDPIKYEFVDGHPDGYNSVTITPTAGQGSATIENIGNVPVPIVIELSKGFTVVDPEDEPPTITNDANDQSITIIAGTSSTNKLEIDTYNREVLEVQYDTVTPTEVVNVSNGRAKVSVLIDWIYLQPGNNQINLTDFPNGSTCTILYRSGWIGQLLKYYKDFKDKRWQYPLHQITNRLITATLSAI